MVDIDREEALKYSVFTGIGLALIMAFIIAPSFAGQDTYIITTGNSGGTGNSTVTSIHAGSGIAVNQTTGNVLVSNTAQESTVCTNRGTGVKIHVSGTNCTANSLIAGNGISITNTTDDYTFTNTLPEQGCSSAGGTSIWKTASTCDAKGLAVTSPITLTSNTDDLTLACPTCSTTSSSMQLLNSATLPSNAGNKLTQTSGTATNFVCNDTTKVACGEHLTSTSALIGTYANSMTVSLRKSNTPTGTLTFCIADSTGTCVSSDCTFGTLSIAGLTTTTTENTVTNPSAICQIPSNSYAMVKSDTIQTGANSVTASFSTTDVYDSTNSVASSLTGTTWTDTTTQDMGSSAASGDWKFDLLNQLTVTFSAKKYLYVESIIKTNTNAVQSAFQFNGDTNTNYAYRRSPSGGTEQTGTNANQCQFLGSGTLNSGDSVVLNAIIQNISGDRKAIWGANTGGSDTGAGTLPFRSEYACKWDNTNQITSISLMSVSGAGFFSANTEIWVWGHD